MRKRKRIEQKLLGVVFLIVSLLILIVALTAKTEMDSDITFLLISVPLGFYFLFTKKIILV